MLARISCSVSRTIGSSGWPCEHRVEAVAPRRLRYRPRDELEQVDPVSRERLDRAMERAGLVVGDERERSPPRLAVDVEANEVADRHEARVRLRVVADVFGDHRQPVQRGRALACDRRLGRVAVGRDLRSSVTGRGRRDGRRPRHVREQPPALVERDRMRAHDADLLERHVGDAHEAVADRQDGLGRDRERRAVQQVVRLGDGAGERALDREHAERDRAAQSQRRRRRGSSAAGRARRPGRGGRTLRRCARRHGRGSRRASSEGSVVSAESCIEDIRLEKVESAL